MTTGACVTIVKMIESLPEPLQERTIEHMQEYIEDTRDEHKWNFSIGMSQSKLIADARQARKEIIRGKATALDM